MRAAVLLAVVMAVVMAVSGCFATLPLGWEESNADHLDAVATQCMNVVYGQDADPSEIVRALRNVGWAGAKAFLAAETIGNDDELQLQAAVGAMEGYARLNYQEMFADRPLGHVIRGVTGVAAVDADQVLGLLWAALYHDAGVTVGPAP